MSNYKIKDLPVYSRPRERLKEVCRTPKYYFKKWY